MAQRKGPRLEGRDGEIWQRYIAGWTQERIATEYKIGQQRVSQIIKKVRESIPEEERNQVRTAVIERLDIAVAEAFDIMRTPHYVVSNAGKIVHDIIEYARDDDGNYLLDDHGNPKATEIAKLIDDAPRLQAAQAIVKIDAERRKLPGLDSPTKLEHSGGVRYEITGLDD
ncbi:sigma factor-like helix-turn-helix DNA-binding protein [Nocardiopsis lucentensis]|uniref:sigma factor-like helix-turn-helix DNA-binding protein n=1 Tax=Nocardiopsis lucentensis TaxID=53441 RepID=UPI00034C9F94|nr:sigma factor-like helix-turn-helix DNA-binding protein [Nocardiopsis lucentensis]